MQSTRGTTLVEMVVALTMLMIGVLGLIGTSVIVNRYLGQGRWRSVVSAGAAGRLESLRAVAASQGCAGLSGGMATYPGNVTERWSVTPNSASADLLVVLSAPRVRPETLATTISCP